MIAYCPATLLLTSITRAEVNKITDVVLNSLIPSQPNQGTFILKLRGYKIPVAGSISLRIRSLIGKLLSFKSLAVLALTAFRVTLVKTLLNLKCFSYHKVTNPIGFSHDGMKFMVYFDDEL